MMEVRTIKDIAYEFSDGILMLVCALWQYWLWSFQGRNTKLERFLAKKPLCENNKGTSFPAVVSKEAAA